MLAITGCSSNQSNTTSANKGSDNSVNHPSTAATDIPFASSETVSPSSVPENQSAEVSQKGNKEITSINGIISDYDVVRTSFDKNSNDIKIFFPQINGLSDKTKQEKINDLIRNTALVDGKDDINLYRTFDLNYTMLWSSNNLLSIMFSGYYDEKQAPHPNRVCNTVNIDMKSGNIIKLDDIVNMNSDFVQLFIDKSEFVDSGATLDFETIKKDYFNADNLKIYFENNEAYYFTSTGLVFYVSTEHAIGDYALFSLSFSDISKYIKPKSQWEDIKSDFPITDFQIIRDQCFKTTLPGFGSTWFISGFDESSNGILRSLKFYLLDDNGNVKYTFPDFNCSDLGYYSIRAISFNDVNHDGNNDVIIISALNKDQYPELDEAKVYLSDKNNFIMDDKFNAYINTTLKDTKIVSDVLNAGKDFFK